MTKAVVGPESPEKSPVLPSISNCTLSAPPNKQPILNHETSSKTQRDNPFYFSYSENLGRSDILKPIVSANVDINESECDALSHSMANGIERARSLVASLNDSVVHDVSHCRTPGMSLAAPVAITVSRPSSTLRTPLALRDTETLTPMRTAMRHSELSTSCAARYRLVGRCR